MATVPLLNWSLIAASDASVWLKFSHLCLRTLLFLLEKSSKRKLHVNGPEDVKGLNSFSCLFWGFLYVYCLFHFSAVHYQYWGRQTGLQNWQAPPRPRAQRRRDGWGKIHLTRIQTVAASKTKQTICWIIILILSVIQKCFLFFIPFQTLTIGSTTLTRKSKRI